MEPLLLTVIIAVAVIRWFYLKQRLAEMSQRIDALARLVVQTQAQAKPATGPFPVPAPPTTRPAPPPPPPPPMGQVVTTPSPVVATPVPPVEAPTPVLEPVMASAAAPPMPVAPPPTPVVEAPVSTAQPVAPVGEPVMAHVAPPPPPRPADQERPAPEPRPMPTPAFATPARAPRRSSADLEALVGGNLFQKVGILVIVIALVFLLGYAFTYTGPAGRVLMSLGVSLAMLIGGVVLEKRERYRTFGQGFIGGGWAALYFTVYAMQSVDAAKVIDNPLLGAVLLLLVASGMIIHSLKYRSQTVTGLAYFIAFGTLAITQVTPLSVIAVIPLSASLLYVAQRFNWKNFAVFGLVATYAICASRGDNGAPLWQVQTLFAIYWLMFEAFDVMRPHRALLPLNAVGFLTLSLAAWDKRDPQYIWVFLGVTALAYLAGAIVRARSDQWRPAATLTAALFAAAIFVKLDYQWVAIALLIEAELFYLAGVRLRAPYLRVLAGGLFTLEVGHFLVRTVGATKAPVWTPAAVANVIVFYANRALRSADVYYGYAAAAMMALIAGFDAPHGDRGLAWMVLAAGPFLIGWRWRQVDFRIQAYALAALGPAGMAFWWPEPPLSMGIGAALAYAGALCALKSNPDRFTDGEPDALRSMGSLFASCMLAALVWHVVPAQYLGLSWLALAAVLLELGMRNLPADFRRQSYALAIVGAALVVINNFLPIHNDGPWKARLIPAGAALVLYAMSARARKEERGAVLNVGSFIATGFLLTGLWAVLPPVAVGPAWAVVALVLMEFDMPVLAVECHLVSIAAFARLFFANFDETQRLMTALTVLPVLLSHYLLWSRTHKRFYLYTAAILASVLARFEMGRVFTTTGWAVLMVGLLYEGKRWKIRDLEWQSYALGGMAFGQCWGTNFYSPDMFAGFAGPVFVGSTVIACLYIAQLLNELDSRARMYFSVLGSLLLAVLLYYQVSGSMLTVVWAVEGIVLMAAGFPLRDRVLRLSGMALLVLCIGKCFWDIRHLEMLPRILSLMGLGVILLGGSWVYTRFGDVLFGRTGRAGEPRGTV